jgi:hypothetical protein
LSFKPIVTKLPKLKTPKPPGAERFGSKKGGLTATAAERIDAGMALKHWPLAGMLTRATPGDYTGTAMKTIQQGQLAWFDPADGRTYPFDDIREPRAADDIDASRYSTRTAASHSRG